jgi:hypothetical protein
VLQGLSSRCLTGLTTVRITILTSSAP